MTYVITGDCVSDTACVDVCPVDCIHPTVDDPDFGIAEMLYIDPLACVDCSACADICPVGAVTPENGLEGWHVAYIDMNAAYFRQRQS